MPGEYETIGERYLITKAIPWKKYAERHSFAQAVGPLEGQRVVDIACGDGFFTRDLARAGATGVVGIDLSHRMIELAREQERRAPLGIRYEVSDAAELGELATRLALGTFDLATAEWLLDYAATREHLRRICRSLAAVVRPGGRFVHMGGCFDSIFHHSELFERYLPVLTEVGPPADGAKVRWRVDLDGAFCSAENTMWTPQTITAELQDAGFVDVQWPKPLLGPDAVTAMGEDYWADFLEHPYFAVTVATRSAG